LEVIPVLYTIWRARQLSVAAREAPVLAPIEVARPVVERRRGADA
jgi:hypothetical protein